MKTTFITATAVGASSIALSLFISHWKKNLSRKITHSSERGQVSPSAPINVKTIPDEIFTPKYFCLYDSASKSVPRCHLPNDVGPDQLLTLLLRRNMSTFASLPQAYMLRMVAKPEARKTFDAAYLRTLEFREGDVVCNAYRVKLRTESKVEFEFLMGVDGRLVVSVEPQGGDVVIHNETLMWREESSRQVLPLERGLAQWMHELTSWWMLDSGVQYLKDMKESS